jgi:uncharacterized phage protein (TIGR02218 family)
VKSASAATLAILATGQYHKAELYAFTIAGGSTYRFTTAQMPMTVGADTYGTGLLIKRGPVHQKAGLEVQSLDLMITPQNDHPDAPILFSGVPILQAIRQGILDNCRVTMSKIFLTSWEDTTPGAVPWFQGGMNSGTAGRFSARLSFRDDIEKLNVAMPSNVIQPGCLHAVYDAGCTLSKATFTQTGAVTGTPTTTALTTNLTRANGYFDLATLTFTSGVLNGLSYLVKTYLNSSGAVTFGRPTASAASAGDTFSIVPACKKTQAACGNTDVGNGPAFNNALHFRGYPYVPVPETLYDGGTNTQSAPTLGGQGGSGAGSDFSGRHPGEYTP